MDTTKISSDDLQAGDILCDDTGKPFAILQAKTAYVMHGTGDTKTLWDTVSYTDMGPYLCVDFPDGTDAVIADVPRITADDAGTWLMGSMGWHNGYRVVQRALSYGWTVPEAWQANWDAFVDAEGDGHGVDHDAWDDVHGDDGEIVDRATDFLDLRAPEGHTFVWDAGELSLMTRADAEEFGHFG